MSRVKFQIGCSSFATTSWKSIFYPDDFPKKTGLHTIANTLIRMNLTGLFIDFLLLQIYKNGIIKHRTILLSV